MKRTLNLNKKVSVEIKPKVPFNFDGTVYVYPHFPTPDFQWQKGICWQTMNFKGKFLGLKLENKGTANKHRIKLTIYSKKKSTKQEIKGWLSS